jgi:hypothetical protein
LKYVFKSKVALFSNLSPSEIDDNINQALSNNRAEFLKQEKQKIYEGNSFGAFN